MKVSIAIPTYEYDGKGVECLDFSFTIMNRQTFKDFEVVISDHSTNDEIKKLSEKWSDKLDIKYIHNPNNIGNSAANFNNAIKNCIGNWIKPLSQDDYLAYDDSLSALEDLFDGSGYNWIATGYLHTKDRINFYNYHFPMINPQLHINNTIGTPSCTFFRNFKTEMPLFDENLSYYYDCEYYYRFTQLFGGPKLTTDVRIVNYIWDKSITSGVTPELMEKEVSYIKEKYEKPDEKNSTS